MLGHSYLSFLVEEYSVCESKCYICDARRTDGTKNACHVCNLTTSESADA